MYNSNIDFEEKLEVTDIDKLNENKESANSL